MDTNPTPTQQETLELLPCPFCGVVPTIQHYVQKDEINEGRYLFFVECGNGNCSMAIVSVGGPFTKQEAAIRRWNTRAAVAGPRGDALPICPKCQQGYICEHCGDPIGDYYATAAPADNDAERDEIEAIRARAYNTPLFSAGTYAHDIRRLLRLLTTPTKGDR